MASHHNPLDSTIFAELQRAASSSHSCNSDQNLLFDILTLAHFIGPRVSEYAQTTQDKVDYHVYPYQGHALSKRSLPITSPSTTKTATSSQKLTTHHSTLPHPYRYPLAHPEELSKWQENQTLYGYKEPRIMPRPGSTANGHESPPSCTNGRHAGCLLQNQESPIAIHHRQQDCYTPLQGSKESTTIYFS